MVLLCTVSDARFEFIEHTADWAMHVVGRDFEQLLLSAAAGLNTLMSPKLSKPGEQSRTIELAAIDREGLLVEWLTELAYLAETERLLFHHFDFLDLSTSTLKCRLLSGQAAELQREIKAVTYHDLRLVKTAEGLEVVIVFDV